MAKSEVYSWRLSAATKAALEDEARREDSTVGGLLERMAQEWLRKRRRRAGDDDEQARIRARVMKLAGSIHGGDPTRSSRVRELMRARLKERHGR